MKRPDLLIIITVWEFISAFAAFMGIIAISVFAFPAVSSLHGIGSVAGIFGLSIAVLVLLFYLSIAIAGGIGLLGGKEWGRILSLVHAALSLLSIPLGTIIGILIIVYLIKPEIRDYFESAKK
jgi:hypothetical protein